MASMKSSLSDDLKTKLKEIAWFVAIGLLRWLLERLVGGNPGEEDEDAGTKH